VTWVILRDMVMTDWLNTNYTSDSKISPLPSSVAECVTLKV